MNEDREREIEEALRPAVHRREERRPRRWWQWVVLVLGWYFVVASVGGVIVALTRNLYDLIAVPFALIIGFGLIRLSKPR